MTNSRPAKRLTYIVNYLSPDDNQHFVHIPSLLTGLQKLGWKIDLVSERGGQGRSIILGHEATFLSYRSKTRRMACLLFHLIKMRLKGGRLVFVRISKLAAFASGVTGRLLGWKTIYWLSGTVEDFNLRSGVFGRIKFIGMWILFRLVDRLATGPEIMVDYYAQTYGLPRNKIILLYNDIKLGKVTGGGSSTLGGEARILLVHRLSPVRETHRYFPALLEALSAHCRSSRASTVILDICGDGPERDELENISKAASPTVQIRFHGAVPQRELARYYDAAMIFIMPSYREGFPRVMLEAMAHGLPIVATDAGGTRDLCGPLQQQFVIDRDDALAFGAAVARLLGSASDRQALAAENLATVQRFETSVIATMYDQALTNLIAAKNAVSHP